MEKKTKFVKSEEAKADAIEQTQKLAPYTNTVAFSVKLGCNPTQKEVNGYQVTTFTGYHWQPKNKPQVSFTMLIYDEGVQTQAMELKQGQSIVVKGKMGYDTHNGVAKLFIFADSIE